MPSIEEPVLTPGPVRWPDDADAVIRGDLVVAGAYVTPAGGAVVTSLSPVGLADRDAGRTGFTTSLGFPKKLDRILRDPRVCLAYHVRDHGFARSGSYVLVQGVASVDLHPSPERLAELMRAAGRFLGENPRGRAWDWVLREYQRERVFVDVAAERIAVWPGLDARGPVSVTGRPWPAAPGTPAEQAPPRNGTAPRVDVAAVARQVGRLPHQLLAYRGADGFPVIVPVTVTGHDQGGLRLAGPSGTPPPALLPPGGRRAGLLAHAFRAQCTGQRMRTLTGWLTVSGDEIRYAPHTSKGLAAPANKTAGLLAGGLLAKYGLWRARRDGTAAHLEDLLARGPAR